MTTGQPLTGLARRERKGSEKRQIGIRNIQRMLPGTANGMHGGNIPPGAFSGDTSLMAMEDSYCDMWDRNDVIDARTRSLLNVSLMIGVGNVGNQFELQFHAPGAIYNGATVADLEAIIVHARAYVGSPAAAWAMQSIVAALDKHELIKAPLPQADVARKERTGSEKRAIAREVLKQMEPDSPLLALSDTEMPRDVFAPELDYMTLENVYFDLWERTHVLSRRDRSVVTLGLLMGLGAHEALAEHTAVALRNGVTVPELEEFVYQAATYLGYVSGASIRATIARALRHADPRERC
ncbi:MAG: carboxymuconolactone decarboxylase [Phenylobacterium sp.]|nr:carboxymuconolactone decarboxylase [Phenylobacterium sp.]